MNEDSKVTFLVIDVGTSSMRGILYTKSGKSLSSKQIRYSPKHKMNGEVVQDPKEFTDALVTIVHSVCSHQEFLAREIAFISITAQRSSIIPVDQQGVPLMNTIMWQDIRNTEICEELSLHNDLIFEKSGAKVNTVFSGGKMSWIRQKRPDIYNGSYKLLNIAEYLIHFMTGKFITDYTYGSRSNLMNLKTRSWDDPLLEIFLLDKEKLCDLIEPGSVCGTITADFSKKSGLKQGIPVVSAGGDQQCAAIGQGIFLEGTASIVVGTGAFLVVSSEDIPSNLSDNLICNCSSENGKYIIEANILTCSSAFDWFCKNFYDWKQGQIDYKRINNDLEKIYGNTEDCLVLPYFQGRSTPEWNPTAKALFSNITLGTKREEIMKAILEGIFLEISTNIQVLSQYTNIHTAYISGGLTNSSVMNHMQADVYGIPLYRMKDSESTSLGALIVTLVKQGIFSSYEEAFKMIRNSDETEKYDFQEKLHEGYKEKLKEMNQMYKKVYG